MLIGIEASRANRLQKTGVEWYAYRMIQGMKQLPEANDHSWLLYSNDPLAMGLEKGPANWHETRLRWPPKYLWTQVRLTWEMYRHSPDVLFVPAHVLPRVSPRRSVVTIHDVGFHRYPQLYKPRQVHIHEITSKDIVKRAARILTVSNFSKQEIMDVYGAREDQIFVTHLGVDHTMYRPMQMDVTETILQRLRISTPFVLFIGRLEAKKNIAGLIEGFVRYKSENGLGDPLALVLAGPRGMGFDEAMKPVQAAGLQDSVHELGYISEEEKVGLLSRASALIHPAWYEGFGLTPLEAMACGCPVICARTSSLPEVVGEENAIWFDPNNIDQLAQSMKYLMGDPATQQRLREQGLAYAQRFTWEKTTKQTFDVLTKW